MKYIKKPVTVEAFVLGFDRIPQWYIDALNRNDIVHTGKYGKIDSTSISIKTPDGTMKAQHGDYIVKGIEGEIYPCKPIS